jgi:hypothetical protein
MVIKGVKEEDSYIGAFPTEDRLIFLIFLILLAVSPFLPWPATQITPATEASFDAIEAVPDNGAILWTTDFTMATWYENGPPEIALYKHMFQRARDDGVKIVITNTESAEGFIASSKILAEEVNPDDYDLEYGEDYVRLGWIPGYETALAGLLSDLNGITGGKDFEGTSLSSLPMMADLTGAGSFQLVGYSTSTNPDTFTRQWGVGVGQNNVPVTLKDGSESDGALLIGNIGTASVAWLMPYIDAGVQTSYVSGVRGGAEYEGLIGEEGLGVEQMAGLSIGHFYGVVLIIVTNAMYLYSRRT